MGEATELPGTGGLYFFLPATGQLYRKRDLVRYLRGNVAQKVTRLKEVMPKRWGRAITFRTSINGQRRTYTLRQLQQMAKKQIF